MTRSERKCPICSKARSEDYTPFCSKRCRDRDLLQWLDDGYALPGPPSFGAEFSNNPQDD